MAAKRNLPLNSKDREERCGDGGFGKLGIGFDLNVCYFLGLSMCNLVLATVPLLSVLRVNGWVILGGADLRSKLFVL